MKRIVCRKATKIHAHQGHSFYSLHFSAPASDEIEFVAYFRADAIYDRSIEKAFTRLDGLDITEFMSEDEARALNERLEQIQPKGE